MKQSITFRRVCPDNPVFRTLLCSSTVNAKVEVHHHHNGRVMNHGT